MTPSATTTVRLVYADWLDERNDPRGEYLRLDVEIRRHQRDQLPVHPELLARHLALEGEIDWEWVSTVTRVTHDLRAPRLYPWFWRILESCSRNLRDPWEQEGRLPQKDLERYTSQFDEAKCYVNPLQWEECHPHLISRRRGLSEDHADDFAA